MQLHEDRDRAIEVTIAEERAAMAADRADTIVVGCMSMGFWGIAEAVAAELRIPVLNPVKVALKCAEVLVGAGFTNFRRANRVPPKLASGDLAPALDLLDRRR